MVIKLSPVKQKMKDSLNLSPEEYILIVGGSNKDGFYQNFKPNNPKASRVDTVVSCISFWIKKYGRPRTFGGIQTWLEAIESKKINKNIPSEYGKLKTAYIEAIIKNSEREFVATSKSLTQGRCGLCGSLLINGVCNSCG